LLLLSLKLLSEERSATLEQISGTVIAGVECWFTRYDRLCGLDQLGLEASAQP